MALENGLRILLVEDELVIGMVVQEMLVEAGYAVVGWARTAVEATELAVAHRPDLVIMDIRLAESGGQAKDGIAAAIEIFEKTGIRSLFATANTDAQTVSRAASASPLGWLRKPYNKEAMLSAIRSVTASPPGRND